MPNMNHNRAALRIKDERKARNHIQLHKDEKRSKVRQLNTQIWVDRKRRYELDVRLHHPTRFGISLPLPSGERNIYARQHHGPCPGTNTLLAALAELRRANEVSKEQRQDNPEWAALCYWLRKLGLVTFVKELSLYVLSKRGKQLLEEKLDD